MELKTAKKIAKIGQILIKHYLPCVGRTKEHGGHVLCQQIKFRYRKLENWDTVVSGSKVLITFDNLVSSNRAIYRAAEVREWLSKGTKVPE